tara:strand:+ start:345 stop:1175 length:831 start_codon:yes stop_codon:yes gene_type:complete
MDLNKIKSRLANLNQASKPKTGEKKDYTLVYWKPKAEGKYQIRFVPSKLNKDNPFQEIFMHYGVGKFPIVALTNWGEEDPIVDFSKKLRKSSESENWRLAKQLDPKMRVFAPVIVRGEEEKGVRLFEFSKTLYLELLSVADDEDYGDFTDVAQGFDFVVTATKVQDRPGFGLSVRPKPKQTQLSEDASQIESWLENQPLLLEERYKYTYDKLKEELQKFLTGGEEEEGSISSEPAVGFEEKPANKEEKKFSLSTQGKPKQDKSKEFDSLFEDDLPF